VRFDKLRRFPGSVVTAICLGASLAASSSAVDESPASKEKPTPSAQHDPGFERHLLSPRRASELQQRWGDRLRKADAQIVAGDYAAAQKAVTWLLLEMRNSIVRGKAAGVWLGMGVLTRGVARAGSGDRGGALWDWHEAIALNPKLATIDLAFYGLAGERLREWNAEVVALREAMQREAEGRPSEGAVKPPKSIRREEPDYPPAKSAACISGPVIVTAIIDKEGVPTTPHAEASWDPVFVYASFEALRSWRFKPAMLNGVPISVYYSLTVNFRWPRCTDSDRME
jgi:hypothetical protein